VIARYGDRIRAVLRDTNGGQTEAINTGWPLARYPLLMFLDSDDLLLAHAAATVSARWRTETVKLQFPLVTIDQSGREVGHVYPKYPPHLDTATIRAELLRSGGSPNSPASGNAYSRSLLEAVMRDAGFELENPREYWMDFILNCNASFYGEVVTLYEPLACYRVHDRNLYAIRAIDAGLFTRMPDSVSFELEYFASRCRKWGILFNPAAARNRSLWALECRLMAVKLASNKSGCDKDSSYQPIFLALHRALRACVEARLPVPSRIIRAVWLISVALSAQPVARRLIALRFVVDQRPAWFSRLLANANLSGWRSLSHGQARSREG
jgi:hypothetical protein